MYGCKLLTIDVKKNFLINCIINDQEIEIWIDCLNPSLENLVLHYIF